MGQRRSLTRAVTLSPAIIDEERIEQEYNLRPLPEHPPFIQRLLGILEFFEPSPFGKTKAVGAVKNAKLINKLPTQLHHFATNKSKKYTPRLQAIAKRYGLNLDDMWNKELLLHQGRHPDAYHNFVEAGMERAAREAGDDKGKFLELYEKYVKDPIRQNPELLRKSGWEQ